MEQAWELVPTNVQGYTTSCVGLVRREEGLMSYECLLCNKSVSDAQVNAHPHAEEIAEHQICPDCFDGFERQSGLSPLEAKEDDHDRSQSRTPNSQL